MAAPITGPASDIGNQQVRWAKYFVKRWNKKHSNARIKMVMGDTQLGVDTAFAVKAAKSFASNSKVLGVVGPAGSQEVVASTTAYKQGGLGFVSGSASRTTLTDGHTDGNRRGYFYRTVPNDAAQGPAVANWMTKKLKWKRVYIIDDQETYSQGLADGVQKILNNRGVTTKRDSISQKDSTSRRRSQRSRTTTRASTSPGSLLRRPRRSASSYRQPARATSSCSARTVCSLPACGRSQGRTTRRSRTTRTVRSSRPT
jgi:ABC-type branched-subunit amino acid transport system substrate-binding protein